MMNSILKSRWARVGGVAVAVLLTVLAIYWCLRFVRLPVLSDRIPLTSKVHLTRVNSWYQIKEYPVGGGVLRIPSTGDASLKALSVAIEDSVVVGLVDGGEESNYFFVIEEQDGVVKSRKYPSFEIMSQDIGVEVIGSVETWKSPDQFFWR